MNLLGAHAFWCVTFLIGVGVWFSFDLAARKVHLDHADFINYYPSFRYWFLERLLSGEWPSWNPYWGIGQSIDIEATIPIDIYSLLEAVFGAKYYLFQVVQAIFLLLAGFYSFRLLGLPAMVATCAALFFFFSPWVLNFFFYFTVVNIHIGFLVTVPHIFLWFERGRRKHLAWISGAIAFTLFGTRPEFWLNNLTYFALLAICYAGFRRQSSRLWPCLLALLLGVAIHAWQIVPLLQILGESGRLVGSGARTLLESEIYGKFALSVRQSGFLHLVLLGALLWLSASSRGWRRVVSLGLALLTLLVLRMWRLSELAALVGSYGGGALLGAIAWRYVMGATAVGMARAFSLFLPLSYYWCRGGLGDLNELYTLHLASAPLQMVFGFFAFAGSAAVEKHRRAPIFYAMVLLLFLVRDQGQIFLSYIFGLPWFPTRDNFLFDFSLGPGGDGAQVNLGALAGYRGRCFPLARGVRGAE